VINSKLSPPAIRNVPWLAAKYRSLKPKKNSGTGKHVRKTMDSSS
jgi:hypothetical protein